MEIPSKYDPALTEDRWYKYWMDHGFFKSVPDKRKPYCIVIPPPNVTGVLHMGHMLNNTIQDVLVRRARMMGKNACWVPGTDHASIATEARVVNKLAQEGIRKTDLTRDQFLDQAWEWTHKHGGIILEQLKKLGSSCDWDRTCFTMDVARSESVIKVFADLYNKGYIYRGVRMINWDPSAKTAVSDEEVNYEEVKSKLYYVKYMIKDFDAGNQLVRRKGGIPGAKDHIIVATTRPETILGDTAVCVNPNDQRYKHLKGKHVVVPMVNRIVPVIFDEYVDPEFGTGALKITPAHDLADYELGLKYKLEVIDIFNDDGTLNEKAQLFVGTDRSEARDLSVKMLQEQNLLVKTEDYTNKIGFSERTQAVIEPRLSVQWFLKMKELSAPALENVVNGTIKLHPEKFINTYKHWMENVKDWCISRQLWWGHRIPAYYLPDGDFVVAENTDDALKLAIEKTKNKSLKLSDLKQDEDVLDTWFSSWLWPISVFDGIRYPGNNDIKYYYPTDVLVTAPDILFFWVARMIISGYEFRSAMPFHSVYLTGMVRDKQRRKMSKSLGNSPEPMDLIMKYSADGVRVGMLLCSPAGNDVLFDEALTEQGRNFGNKIWNAFRLVKQWQVDNKLEQPGYAKSAINWFDNQLNKSIHEIEEQFESYRISEALMTVYKLFWDEFSSWYLEMIKPEYQKPIDKKTYDSTLIFFDKLLKLLHPFMPFITEEIWQLIEDRKDGESIMITKMPQAGEYNQELIDSCEEVKAVVSFIRTTRTENKIGNGIKLSLWRKFDKNKKKFDEKKVRLDNILVKLGNLDNIDPDMKETPGRAATLVLPNVEYYIPLGDFIDVEEEIRKLEDELKYTIGFLASVNKKLSNERFVNNAPKEVIDIERKKQSDAESKIKALEIQIKILKP
jgi:valyl-tRNA synthetase